MVKEKQYLIILDTEFTSWKGAQESGWAEKWQHREIIQIAAMKVELPSFKPVKAFNIIVKPKTNPQLSDYIQKLTGLDQDLIDKEGVDYPTALKKFTQFAEPHKNRMASYGEEWRIFDQNCAIHKISNPIKGDNFANIRKLVSHLGIDGSQYTSGTLHNAAGVDMEGHVHNAMFDVYSMIEALKKWHKEDKIPTAMRDAFKPKAPPPKPPF